MTLRISPKGDKPSPRIVYREGRQDNQIKSYLEHRRIIKDIVKKPGSGGKIFRKLADQNINIDLIYLAENNRIIIGVDDLDKARAVI